MNNKSSPKKTHAFEFGGPIGAAFMIVGLPMATLYINFMCTKNQCSLFQFPRYHALLSLFDLNCLVIVIAWLLFQVLLSLLHVGPVVNGQPLSNGAVLKYRCNGFAAAVMSLICFMGLIICGVDVTFVYAKFPQFIFSSIVISGLLAVYLFARSFMVCRQELSEGGNTESHIYNFFIGRELNPRIKSLDLKFFCELRPGLIGWLLLDLVFNVEYFKSHGHLSWHLLCVTLFHAVYILDALWHEEAILTTMDITHDGFGFMLTFGDLVWVPFLYSLQARFILEQTGMDWPAWSLVFIFAFNALGYIIFRKSNSQKNLFRKDPLHPSVSYLKTLTTETGRKLLVEGWWGMCRHPNYMGDLLMALSWSLVTGYTHIIPYFYPIYFLGLLVHRCQRDDLLCSKKYGKDWKTYCRIVPYKIFPYVY